MTAGAPLSVAEARAWIRRWDAMQTSYIPGREARFQLMFDFLEAGLPAKFRVLDLGAGPGSLSARLLERFPRARSVAVDYDPVLPVIGKRALSPRIARRLTWVDADLRDPRWTRALPPGRFEAAVSTTALHWLKPRNLQALYRALHRLLLPGGLFLNGDKASLPEDQPVLRSLIVRALEVHRRRSPEMIEPSNEWLSFWHDLAKVPSVRALIDERNRRFPDKSHHENEPSAARHLRYLRQAGFSESDVAWRRFSNVILIAKR
jgi:SAM-dependent methyltransferase